MSVFGEDDPVGGNAAEERLKLTGFRIEANQLARGDGTGREDLFPVFAEHGTIPVDWARGQLEGLVGRPPKQPVLFIESVELGVTPDRSGALEGIELSVRRPAAATFGYG